MLNNIGLFLTKRAHISPKVEAFVNADTRERYTFTELNERSNRIAHVLLDLGVKPGDRVTVECKKVFWRRRKLRAEAEMKLDDGTVVCSGNVSGMGVMR